MTIELDDAQWAALVAAVEEARNALDSGTYRARVTSYGGDAATTVLAAFDLINDLIKEN